MPKRKVENYIPMFAYGILKYPHNILEEGGKNIVENAKVKGFRLYAQGGKGISLATPYGATQDDEVIGTYFEVPESVVYDEYDFIEGFNPSSPPIENMYNRRMVEVTLPNGKVKQANMYIANVAWFWKDFIPEFRIESGNSDDKYLLILKLYANKEEEENEQNFGSEE
jgi:gamma-glutamylcyclotransferase (GGCT)/AIG2-like uncharacterized protein YtfP